MPHSTTSWVTRRSWWANYDPSSWTRGSLSASSSWCCSAWVSTEKGVEGWREEGYGLCALSKSHLLAPKVPAGPWDKPQARIHFPFSIRPSLWMPPSLLYRWCQNRSVKTGILRKSCSSKISFTLCQSSYSMSLNQYAYFRNSLWIKCHFSVIKRPNHIFWGKLLQNRNGRRRHCFFFSCGLKSAAKNGFQIFGISKIQFRFPKSKVSDMHINLTSSELLSHMTFFDSFNFLCESWYFHLANLMCYHKICLKYVN